MEDAMLKKGDLSSMKSCVLETLENEKKKKTFLIVWLVVWLPFLIFPYIGFLIIPIDEFIFYRGVAKNHQPDIFDSRWIRLIVKSPSMLVLFYRC